MFHRQVCPPKLPPSTPSFNHTLNPSLILERMKSVNDTSYIYNRICHKFSSAYLLKSTNQWAIQKHILRCPYEFARPHEERNYTNDVFSAK